MKLHTVLALLILTPMLAGCFWMDEMDPCDRVTEGEMGWDLSRVRTYEKEHRIIIDECPQVNTRIDRYDLIVTLPMSQERDPQWKTAPATGLLVRPSTDDLGAADNGSARYAIESGEGGWSVRAGDVMGPSPSWRIDFTEWDGTPRTTPRISVLFDDHDADTDPDNVPAGNYTIMVQLRDDPETSRTFDRYWGPRYGDGVNVYLSDGSRNPYRPPRET